MLIGRRASGTTKNTIMKSFFKPSNFSKDTSLQISPPKIKTDDLNIYHHYVELGKKGTGFEPKINDVNMYQKYVLFK